MDSSTVYYLILTMSEEAFAAIPVRLVVFVSFHVQIMYVGNLYYYIIGE